MSDESFYFNEGNNQYNQGKYDEAIEYFNKATNINPNYAQGYNGKGNSLQNLGRNDEAIESYNQAIRINPNYINAYVNKGKCFLTRERNEEALECFNQAISLDPNFLQAYVNKAFCLDDAIESYSQFLSLNHDSILAFIGRAQMYLSFHQRNLAFQDLQSASQLLKDGKKTGLSADQIKVIQSQLSNLQIFQDEVSKFSNQIKMVRGNNEEKENLEKNTNQFLKLINQAIQNNTLKRISFLNNNNNKANEDRIEQQRQLQEDDNTIKQNLEQVQNKLQQSGNLQCIQMLQEQINELRKEIADTNKKVEDVENDIKDAGVQEKAEVHRKLKAIEDGDVQQFNNFKTFYWTLINMFQAYRMLSTDLFQSNYKSSVGKFIDDNQKSIKDGLVKCEESVLSSKNGMVKTGLSLVKGIVKAIPFVGGIVSAIDDVVGIVVGGIQYLKDQDDKNNFQKNIKAINAVIQNKFGLEDEISIKIAQVAIQLTELRKERILSNSEDDDKTSGGKSWFYKRIDSIKSLIVPQLKLSEEKGNRGIALALRDVTLLLAYMCKNSDEIIRNKSTSLIQMMQDIVINKELENLVKDQNDPQQVAGNNQAQQNQVSQQNSTQQQSSTTQNQAKNQQSSDKDSCSCSIFIATDFIYDDAIVNLLSKIGGTISKELFNILISIPTN